ncbi:MAG TPA: hypothetical protein VD811_01345 [Desulfuromonadales bacterium]|nr:hypothetical protein [Desulfuromonadales bacterium]
MLTAESAAGCGAGPAGYPLLQPAVFGAGQRKLLPAAGTGRPGRQLLSALLPAQPASRRPPRLPALALRHRLAGDAGRAGAAGGHPPGQG